MLNYLREGVTAETYSNAEVVTQFDAAYEFIQNEIKQHTTEKSYHNIEHAKMVAIGTEDNVARFLFAKYYNDRSVPGLVENLSKPDVSTYDTTELVMRYLRERYLANVLSETEAAAFEFLLAVKVAALGHDLVMRSTLIYADTIDETLKRNPGGNGESEKESARAMHGLLSDRFPAIAVLLTETDIENMYDYTIPEVSRVIATSGRAKLLISQPKLELAIAHLKSHTSETRNLLLPMDHETAVALSATMLGIADLKEATGVGGATASIRAMCETLREEKTGIQMFYNNFMYATSGRANAFDISAEITQLEKEFPDVVRIIFSWLESQPLFAASQEDSFNDILDKLDGFFAVKYLDMLRSKYSNFDTAIVSADVYFTTMVKHFEEFIAFEVAQSKTRGSAVPDEKNWKRITTVVMGDVVKENVTMGKSSFDRMVNDYEIGVHTLSRHIQNMFMCSLLASAGYDCKESIYYAPDLVVDINEIEKFAQEKIAEFPKFNF